MSENLARPTYQGDRRSLVIAIDFGTTYSGVSYAFLEPGLSPKIRSVTGFPGQEDHDSSPKVPTVLLYDNNGVLRAAGAKTNDLDIVLQAETEGWRRIEWFKLLLRPKDMNFHEELENAPISELPDGMTIEMLLGDFFNYMNTCAKDYITRSHAAGARLWEEAKGRSTYVLSHPNGWHGFQQEKLRRGAILGGLIPDTDEGKARIHFVSEGEASFHWCVDSGLAKESMKDGSNVVIADAGGGTIDVSAFRVTKESPLQLEETKSSECRLAGSIFVTQAFENYIRELLEDSSYGDSDTISRLKNEFDRKTKRLFRADMRAPSVAFGGPREHDPGFNIRAGRLVLNSDEVKTFFEHSCASAVDSIRTQVAGNHRTTVYLVGGFAASPYLFSEIERRLLDANVNVDLLRAESHTAKAVADGAVGFFLDRYVSARVAKYTYGVMCSTEYEPTLASHRKRSARSYYDPVDGKTWLSGEFVPHLEKGTIVKEKSVTSIALHRTVSSSSGKEDCRLVLHVYKGNIKGIGWADEDPDEFHKICTFRGTFPSECLTTKASPNGKAYRRIDYSAVVSFGTTEFKCYVEWKDQNGIMHHGPMSAVWDEG